MSLNIKNERTHALVRELAELTGQSQTSAVEDAVRRRLDALRDEVDRAERGRRLRALIDQARRLGPYQETADWDLRGDFMYDEDGATPVIVDTSVVVAILFGEPEADSFADALTRERSAISAAGYLECSIVADRYAARSSGASARDRSTGAALAERLDAVISNSGLTISPVTRQQADLARWAHREFGVGSGSPARLNFGDCFSYALAKETDEPLLFKGDDFTHTDIRGYLTRDA